MLEFVRPRIAFADTGEVNKGYPYDPDVEFVDLQYAIDEFTAALYAHPGSKCPSKGLIQPCEFCKFHFGNEVYTAMLQQKINRL